MKVFNIIVLAIAMICMFAQGSSAQEPAAQGLEDQIVAKRQGGNKGPRGTGSKRPCNRTTVAVAARGRGNCTGTRRNNRG
jgi:hypothetical protein